LVTSVTQSVYVPCWVLLTLSEIAPVLADRAETVVDEPSGRVQVPYTMAEATVLFAASRTLDAAVTV